MRFSKRRRNYQKGGEVKESKNPWESESVFESWENDPGIQGHLDERSHKLFGQPGDTKIYTAPKERDEDET